MLIIRVELLLEKEEIQNEMPLQLQWFSPSSKVLMDILEFHTKCRSNFGLLSSAYLMVQRFNLLELQMNYLRHPYDIQENTASHFQEKWFNE